MTGLQSFPEEILEAILLTSLMTSKENLKYQSRRSGSSGVRTPAAPLRLVCSKWRDILDRTGQSRVMVLLVNHRPWRKPNLLIVSDWMSSSTAWRRWPCFSLSLKDVTSIYLSHFDHGPFAEEEKDRSRMYKSGHCGSSWTFSVHTRSRSGG
jgi:hypothetical protein